MGEAAVEPVLELGDEGAFDEIGLGEPAVWASAGKYWMLYTGRDRAEHRRIGLAMSDDGVRWQRSGLAPVWGVLSPGTIRWCAILRFWPGLKRYGCGSAEGTSPRPLSG